MPVGPTYASYPIRLRCESETEPPAMAANWHDQAQHIQSGQRRSFSTLDALLGPPAAVGRESRGLGQPADR